jgi:hypothetical protein
MTICPSSQLRVKSISYLGLCMVRATGFGVIHYVESCLKVSLSLHQPVISYSISMFIAYNFDNGLRKCQALNEQS